MPISIVVGGQFGSEGKGKVAFYLAKTRYASAVVRVGGPNSGHTVVDHAGRRRIFRQLPTAAILDHPVCVISAGSYIDMDVLRAEISQTGLDPTRLKIDPKAVIITSDCRIEELKSRLRDRIGSTLTGTGHAVLRRIKREPDLRFAKDEAELGPVLADTSEYLFRVLEEDGRVIVEGTQGFGLSNIHTPYFPFATSRDTTAASVLSEVGLSPVNVDEIAMVIRTFPIRVPGNSGPLPNETTWLAVSEKGDFPIPIEELTSVTRATRRVAAFDPAIVRSALIANAPTALFLNHVDYIDPVARRSGYLGERGEAFLAQVEGQLARRVDYLGLGPAAVVRRDVLNSSRAVA